MRPDTGQVEKMKTRQRRRNKPANRNKKEKKIGLSFLIFIAGLQCLDTLCNIFMQVCKHMFMS